MIEMTVAGVRIEFPSNSPIVLLREADGERFLPIWIGQSEAQAIAIGQQGLVTPRPMTHDLLKNILDEMAVQVTNITITELRDGVFHAVIGLQRNGSSFEISSRPSDAIALAVRLGCKIFANEEVKYRDRQHRTMVLGVDAEWPAVNNTGVDRGRFFTHLDLERRSKVAVVGIDILDELRIPEAIGQEISVSVETVRTHVRNVIRKLQARNRVHAIAIALERGEIALDPGPEDR